MTVGFREFVRSATGHDPYPYQARLAAEGLPGLLNVPTGGGKTIAAVLPWLYRRLVSAPDRTPRRLVYVLPQHSLADQTYARIGEWLKRLDRPPGEVGLHLLAGGSAVDGGWRRRPERTAILIGTHDMLLSRALMRGFADGRGMAAVSYGLLHNDAQWIFDEMHLLGPALPTSSRLQDLRDLLGTAAPTRTMWMSSTWDPAGLSALSPSDTGYQGGLAVEPAVRLSAARRIRRVDLDPGDYVAELAKVLEAAHVPGTQTVAAVNGLERARALCGLLRESGRDVLLVHPWFRAPDRRRIAAELDAPGHDRFIVAAHALEAGVDVSSRTLLTELAPWSSVVQRAGRCNRYGEHPEGGDLLWCTPPDVAGIAGLDAVAGWLAAHEGQAVTSAGLCDARIRPYDPPADPLGRRDVLRLFDTVADPPGSDAVSRWICEPADHMALVAWRDWETGEPAEDEPAAGRDELCPAPLTDVRDAWMRDPLDGHWRHALPADLVPGMTLLLEARRGGYLPDEGWAPESREPVAPLGGQPSPDLFGCLSWVGLDQHLMETEDEARMLLDTLPGLPAPQQEAVARAARYHDLGKCHDVFQEMLRSGGGDPPQGLLAKSQAPHNTGRSARSHFRHEFVSALMLLGGDHLLKGDTDHPLVTYLVAAHHGKVRISARRDGEEPAYFLGVADGERTPLVELSTGERFPSQSLQTSMFKTGTWTRTAEALRDRGDLGPFRLAYLETLVRVADWRSSARHDGPVGP